MLVYILVKKTFYDFKVSFIVFVNLVLFLECFKMQRGHPVRNGLSIYRGVSRSLFRKSDQFFAHFQLFAF